MATSRGDERLLKIKEKLADDEVDTLVYLDAQLFFKLASGDFPGVGVALLVGPRCAEVTRYQDVVAGNFICNLHGLPVQVQHLLAVADVGQFFAAGIEGEGLYDLGAGADELLMQLLHGIRVLQDDLRSEGTGNDITPLFHLQYVSAIAEDHAFGKPVKYSLLHGDLLILITCRGYDHIPMAGGRRPRGRSPSA